MSKRYTIVLSESEYGLACHALTMARRAYAHKADNEFRFDIRDNLFKKMNEVRDLEYLFDSCPESESD